MGDSIMENVKRVTSLDSDDVSVYVGLNEGQLKRYNEPDNGIFICESMKVIKRAIAAGYKPQSFFVEESQLEGVKQFNTDNTPIYMASENVMKNITGYSLTGGVLSAMHRKCPLTPTKLIESCNKIVVLDDVENPTNVGAIFRSAAALGAEAVLLTEGCADPLYRRAARVSMGTVFQLEWTYISRSDILLLKEKGFTLMALSLTDDARSLRDLKLTTNKRAVVLGNEDHGISPEVLDVCDVNVIIPMSNGVDSLNVASASAVAFWEIFDK